MTHLITSQPYLTANIDRLVRNIVFHNACFDDVKNRLNELYQPFMNSLVDELVYSKPIQAFISSTNAIVGHKYPCNVIWNHDKTKRFIDTLSCYENDIKVEDRTLYYQENQNRNQLNGYVRNLTDHYSRLLFVRVDLKYSQEDSHLVTIDMFSDHIGKLRELIGNKKTCFKHLQGYAWALEQGYENGGFHCHLLLIYDGSRREDDSALGKMVGDKWISITEELGTYFNVNSKANKKKYLKKDVLGNDLLGVGMIHRNNLFQIENAVNVALYLTKPSKEGQNLKVWLPNMRSFGRGIYRKSKRRGLPS